MVEELEKLQEWVAEESQKKRPVIRSFTLPEIQKGLEEVKQELEVIEEHLPQVNSAAIKIQELPPAYSQGIQTQLDSIKDTVQVNLSIK